VLYQEVSASSTCDDYETENLPADSLQTFVWWADGRFLLWYVACLSGWPTMPGRRFVSGATISIPQYSNLRPRDG